LPASASLDLGLGLHFINSPHITFSCPDSRLSEEPQLSEKDDEVEARARTQRQAAGWLTIPPRLIIRLHLHPNLTPRSRFASILPPGSGTRLRQRWQTGYRRLQLCRP
jgi:hypothetical protein